jgi:hypothetical protein
MATGRNPVPAFSPLRGRTACTNGGHAEVADDRIAVRHFPPGYARTVEDAARRWAAGSWTAW